MRILMLDPGNYTPYYDANLCRALVGLGHQVTLDSSHYLFESVEPIPGVEQRYPFYGIFDSALGRRLPVLRERPWLRRSIKALVYPPEMLHWAWSLDVERYDVLHVQWALVPLLDSLLLAWLRQRGLRVIYTAHDLPPADAGLWERLGYRRLYHSVDHIVVHAQVLRQQLAARFGIPSERISVLPMGNLGAFRGKPMSKQQARTQLGVPPDAPLLLFFGLIKPYKGLRYLLEALPDVYRRFPDVRLLIAGEPIQDFRSYRRLIVRHELEEAVIAWPRYVPSEQVAVVFSAADVVVLPYVNISLSAVLLTAYTYGRPVIATAVGGLPEAVEDGRSGLIVPPQRPDALAEAICTLLEDRERLEAMGAYARRLAEERHAWPAIARRMVQLYKESP
ncbi:MAG TPA: glycosyltransferase family 1 protein [Anaerolineae bacterium]|nr:glycosyltransferase family 1 protein [Anaerolineae bacterium]